MPDSSSDFQSTRVRIPDSQRAIQDYLWEQGWTDGLPVVPPTLDRVRLALERAGRAPSELIGARPTKGPVITAEQVGTNGGMAGRRPE